MQLNCTLQFSFALGTSEVCGNKQLFIPTSKDELISIAKITRKLPQTNQPVRIWTDYRRINETFFWSDTAKAWWSHTQKHQERAFLYG